MANLRGGSTAGGKQLVTMDTLNTFIYEIQTAELASKMKKAETDSSITDFNTANDYIKSKDKNGLWEVLQASNSDNKYNYGGMFSLSNKNSRFQLYAPHREDATSGLYFRTGWQDDIKSWERVATKTMLDAGLNLKFDKTGGDISGLTSFANNVNIRGTLKVLNQNEGAEIRSINNQALFEGTSAINEFRFNKDVKTSGEIFALSSHKVWHANNFNPNSYMPLNAVTLPAGTNVNTAKTPGFFMVNNPTGVPDSMTGWFYIEIIKHADSYLMQKFYSFNGNISCYRVLENNVWKPFRSFGEVEVLEFFLDSNRWVQDGGAVGYSAGGDPTIFYKYSVTHSYGVSKVCAAAFIQSGTNMSCNIGWKEVNNTTIEIYSANQISGTVRLTLKR